MKKICVLVSYEEPTSILQQLGDLYQNPGLYVDKYDFDLVPIKKEDEVESIQKILNQGYDWIWSFLWGSDSYVDSDVAGSVGTRYLESINYPFIGSSSKLLNAGKLELKTALAKTPKEISFLTPAWITGAELEKLDQLKFPVILKPAYGLASFHMTKKSVCHNKDEVMKQMDFLSTKINGEILIEEFISGVEMSVMVLETKDKGVVAYKPIVYSFPSENKTEQFFDFYNKNYGVDNKEVTFKLFDGDLELEEELKEVSIRAYEALGVIGSGYARIDLRLTPEQKIYILEVNPAPAFFGKPGNSYGDEYIIYNAIPGEHKTVVDTILDSKERFKVIFDYYNNNSLQLQSKENQNQVWKNIIAESEFSNSTILDIGSGIGTLGKYIQEFHSQVQIYGIDISPKLTEIARKAYTNIHLGLAENIIMELETIYDHIIGNGVFQYIDPRNFRKILLRSFALAQKTITITVEDISTKYQENFLQLNNCDIRFNHVGLLKEIQEQFLPTSKWFIEWEKRDYLFTDAKTGDEVYGITVKFCKRN